jgi:transposase
MGKTWSEVVTGSIFFALCNVEKGDYHWMVNIATVEAAHCPDCRVLSTTRHSSYRLQLKDVPVQGRAMELTVRVGRWRCRNSGCECRIFCLPLDVTHKYARSPRSHNLRSFYHYALE